MKVQAPFQGQDEYAGQGFDGTRFYTSVRFVLRALTPSPYRLWRWPFVAYVGPVRRITRKGRYTERGNR